MGEFQEYKTLATTVKAVQWFKNGDHPEDESHEITIDDKTFLSEGKVVRFYRTPDLDGNDACDLCGHVYYKHGWLDISEVKGGLRVCPSDYVVTNEEGDIYPTSAKDFEETYNLRAGYGG